MIEHLAELRDFLVHEQYIAEKIVSGTDGGYYQGRLDIIDEVLEDLDTIVNNYLDDEQRNLEKLMRQGFSRETNNGRY